MLNARAATGEAAAAAGPSKNVVSETADRRHMASQPDDNTQASNSNINNKKRAREEQYPGESPAQSSKEGAVDPAPANERSPKKPRTDEVNSKSYARIDLLIDALFNRYKEVQTVRREHPVANAARMTVRSNLKAVMDQMHTCTPELFATRMQDFMPLAQALRDAKNTATGKTSDTQIEVDEAQRSILIWASEFMDGPLLFNIFPWLQGKHRQLLLDLVLPLDQIRILAAETKTIDLNDHGLYYATKKEEEVKSRCAEILRVLRPDIITSEPITRSYDDAEARNRHDRKLEEQVASMITTQSRKSENKLAVAFEAIASSNTAIASSNAAIASALKENAQTRSSQEVPSKGVSCSAAPVVSTESASEDSSEAVREEYGRKIQHQLERIHQEKASWYLKVENRLREYNDGIEDLKKTQHGGPVPLSIIKLNVADTSACYHRLVHLWKDLKITEGYDVTKLTMNKDLCYSFAIAMREAHFLLHLLVFYGDEHTELRNTGWSLDLMRSLQSDMTPYASDEPLIYCKEDVDVICIALQNAFPEQPLFRAPLTSACETQVPNQPLIVPQGYALHPIGQQPIGQQPFIQQPVVQQPAVSSTVPATQVMAMAVNSGATNIPTCPEFARRGCENYETCTLAHPDSLRRPQECKFFATKRGCKYWLGCLHRHTGSQQHSAPASVIPSSGNLTIPLNPEDEAHLVGAGAVQLGDHLVLSNLKGENLNALDHDNYCRNWGMNKCKKTNCGRIHQAPPPSVAAAQQPQSQRQHAQQQHAQQHQVQQQQVQQQQAQPVSNFSNVNHFQGGGQGVQQAARNNRVCNYIARGQECPYGERCKFSHDPPQPAAQQFSDVQMGEIDDTAMNSDHGAAAAAPPQATSERHPRFNRPCNNENNGGTCTNARCSFIHSNPASATYATTNSSAVGGQNQTRGTQPQPRGRGNFTYDASQPVLFAPPNPGQNVNAWANGVAQQTQQQQQQQQDRRAMPPPPISRQSTQQSAPRNASSNVTCYNCNQRGHRSRECPQSQSNQGGVQQGVQGGHQPSLEQQMDQIIQQHTLGENRGGSQRGNHSGNQRGGRGGRGGNQRGNHSGNQRNGPRVMKTARTNALTQNAINTVNAAAPSQFRRGSALTSML